MDNDSIFGTPPEPVFNLKGSCLSSELLEDLLYVQATHNEKTAQAATSADGAFKQGTIAGKQCLCLNSHSQLPSPSPTWSK